jgi:hypothetical protein
MLQSSNLSDNSETGHRTVVEAALAARLADMSADQRNQVTNRAIDILRTNNAGSEAEMEVRRIMGA